MAIRKTQTSNTVKRTPAKIAPRPAESAAKQYKDIRAELKNAIAPGPGKSAWLSEAEAKSILTKAVAAGPDVAKKVAGELAEALKSGSLDGQPLQVGEAALKAIAEFAGVAAGTFRTVSQNKDATATHQLAEGLVKAKDLISQADVVKTKSQVDEYKLQGQNGTAVSKSEFTPHFKAAKAIGGEIKNAVDAHLAENHPETKAAIDAVSPQVTEMIQATAGEVMKNPEAMKRLSNVISLVGKEGLTDAIKKAGPDVGKAFATATGVPMMNESVVKGALEGFPKLVGMVAPEAAANMTKVCANVGAKLGVELAKEGAEAVAGTVAKSVVKTAAKEGAEAVAGTVAKSVAKTAAKEGAEALAKTGAKTAAKGAATGAKAVPGLGNLISVGSACLSAVGLVKQLFTSPRDGEQIAKAGLNTLLQTVGIAFPWAALAGDVVDMGWSAKIAVSDAKEGKAPKPGLSKQDAAGLVSGPARLLASALDGAGQSGIANSFKGLADVTEKAAGKSVIEAHQMDAISQLSSWAGNEISKAAATETDGATKDALNSVAHGFGELFKVCYQHKKLKGEDGLKRDELKGNLLKITGDVALGVASLVIGGKSAPLIA